MRERRREGEKQTKRYADGQRDRDETDRESTVNSRGSAPSSSDSFKSGEPKYKQVSTMCTLRQKLTEDVDLKIQYFEVMHVFKFSNVMRDL